MSTLSAKEYKRFEDIKRIRPDGSEYWAARELAPVLDYAKWENFYKVIKRAMIACENSGRSTLECFPEVRKTSPMPNGGVKDTESFIRPTTTIIACWPAIFSAPIITPLA